MGYQGEALMGGYTAWKEKYPVEPKGADHVVMIEDIALARG
jgi:hypothetical protein